MIEGRSMRGIATKLFVFIALQCLTAGQELLLAHNCQLSYQIKDKYNVSFHDMGSVCPTGLVNRSRINHVHSSSMYTMTITNNGTIIDLEWKHRSCYRQYYMQFEAIFAPNYVANDNTRKCIKVDITHLTREFEEDLRIHFKCLQIPPDGGTLSVHSNRFAAHDTTCHLKEQSHFKVFNLGCDFIQTEVEVSGCLVMTIHSLHSHIDFEKTTIILNNTYIISGAGISHFNGGPGVVSLPVYGNGIYHVQINLICNAHGQVSKRTFELTGHVTDASNCAKYHPPATAKTTTSPPPADADDSKLPLMITVASLLGTVVIVVTVVFLHRRSTMQGDRGKHENNIERPDEHESLADYQIKDY